MDKEIKDRLNKFLEKKFPINGNEIDLTKTEPNALLVRMFGEDLNGYFGVWLNQKFKGEQHFAVLPSGRRLVLGNGKTYSSMMYNRYNKNQKTLTRELGRNIDIDPIIVEESVEEKMKWFDELFGKPSNLVWLGLICILIVLMFV